MRKRLLNWLGWKLHILARLCFWKAHSTEHCWICGRHPSMGPVWNGHMTCNTCYNEWHYYHKPQEGFVVDWKGLGRLK